MEKLFLSVLNMSLTASFVIAAIILARLMLKKAPKSISYALWAVAGFRLVFPFSFESVFSLIPFKSAPIPADITTQPIPRVDSGIGIVDNTVSSILPAATPAASMSPLQLWLTVGAYLWLTGFAVMLIYSAVSIVLLKKRLNCAVPVENNIFEADNLKTPFVLGLLRPKIYIPAGLTEKESLYIILHERTHIRRHDHIVKFLAYLILCLHWFNPLAWAAFLLMGADMEMSCDELVLKKIGSETKKAYSMSLLSLSSKQRIIGGSPLAFGEGGMKERIKNVLNFKKPSRVIIVAAVTLAAVLSIGFGIDRVTAVTGDYDFYSFSVNGFMLGADANEMDTSALTPAEPLHVSSGYDFNYEEARYSVDANTGKIIKMLVNVYDGAYIPTVIINKDEDPIYIPYNLDTINQVIDIFGQGTGGWQDREQRLRYMEYLQKEGQLSATVRFVYTDGESDGIKHRLVWVIADSDLPYRYPIEIKRITKHLKGLDASSNLDYHIMLYDIDINRDGLNESIYLDQSQQENGFVTLRIYDSTNNEIWSEEAGTSHAGWTSLFLCEHDGEYYLLRYMPGMWQGYCKYTYTLFTLEGGAEHVVQSNAIEFDINGVNKLSVNSMIAFADEVNALLGKSTLLVSSEGGEYAFGPSSAAPFFERYSWLDEAPKLYKDGDDLKTRLSKYSEYAASIR